MSRFIKIGEAAKLLGITVQTLRRWEKEGSFLPDRKSKGKTRYYSLDRILGAKPSENDLTIAYASTLCTKFLQLFLIESAAMSRS